MTLTSMIQNLQALVARIVSPFEAAVLSVTHIEAGATWNVLPQSGFFEGTIRSFNPSLQQRLKEDFIRIVENTAENFGAQVRISWGHTPPVTYNDSELAELLYEHSQNLAEVLPASPSSAGEDFAFIKRRFQASLPLSAQMGQKMLLTSITIAWSLTTKPSKFPFLTMSKVLSFSCSTISRRSRDSCLKADKEKLSPP